MRDPLATVLADVEIVAEGQSDLCHRQLQTLNTITAVGLGIVVSQAAIAQILRGGNGPLPVKRERQLVGSRERNADGHATQR